MYQSIFGEISGWMHKGGKTISLYKDTEDDIWMCLVTDGGNGVYYGYTFNRANQDFVFHLLEFANANKYKVVVTN